MTNEIITSSYFLIKITNLGGFFWYFVRKFCQLNEISRKSYIIYINSLMSLNYEYHFITEVIKLWHAPSIYVCWADHFFYYLFQDVSFLPNLFGLTFIRNQSDLCKQFFIPKSATWRAIYANFMTCSLNINESRQVFYLFNNHGFF